MESLKDYALRILTEHGCDCYTYGGEFSKYVMDDLKTEYPNGMEYSYLDVANAILDMSKPKPIERKPWKMQWDTDSDCDAVGFDSFDAAKSCAMDTLLEWMAEECHHWNGNVPTEEEKENWDYMVYNCCVSVLKYNPDTDDYDEHWSPSCEDLEEIGWKLYEEY